jgi:hypothetical protein
VDAIVRAAEVTVEAQRGPQRSEPERTEPHDEPAPEPEAAAEEESAEESTQDGGPSEDESPAPS